MHLQTAKAILITTLIMTLIMATIMTVAMDIGTSRLVPTMAMTVAPTLRRQRRGKLFGDFSLQPTEQEHGLY